MKTNNPRKNREAKRAAAASAAGASGVSSASGASESLATSDKLKVPEVSASIPEIAAVPSASASAHGASASISAASASARGASSVGANQAANNDQSLVSGQDPEAGQSAGDSQTHQADIAGQATQADQASKTDQAGQAGRTGQADQAGGADHADQTARTGLAGQEGQPDQGEPETVSFSSATEMLMQSQQEIKKAKVAVQRQKRAKEMEAFQKKMHRRRVRKRIILALFGVIALALLALALAFCADRWWLHDDEADIQGTWHVNGSDATVTFTEDSIVLTDEVAYRYELDPESKTIRFSFGNLSGEGYYRFSLDRNQLSVTDGESNVAGDLMEDVGWWVNALIAQIRGYQLAPTIGADSVGFERE